jgi:transposase-like protein
MPFQRGVKPLPTKYNEETKQKAYLLCAIYGATDETLAKQLGVTVRTIQNWKNNHQEFYDVVTLGKELADAKIVNEWFKGCFDHYVWVEEERCIKGQVITTRKQVFVPGNAHLITKWMSIRQPEKWSEYKNATEVNNTTNYNVLNAAFDSLTTEQLKSAINYQIKQIPKDVDQNE